MIRGRIVTPASTAVKRGYTRKRAPVKMCSRCGLNPCRKRGTLCHACVWYKQMHNGELRPQALIQAAIVRRQQSKWCENCTHTRIHANERCYLCYQYFRRTGRERPRWLWDKDIRCTNCGYPKQAPGNFYGDMCGACNCYKRRTGKDRPKALWGIGAYGFCACGYPAEHQHDGFDLCNRCFGEATR